MSDYLSRLAQRSLSASPSPTGDRDPSAVPWLRPRPTSRFEDSPTGRSTQGAQGLVGGDGWTRTGGAGDPAARDNRPGTAPGVDSVPGTAPREGSSPALRGAPGIPGVGDGWDGTRRESGREGGLHSGPGRRSPSGSTRAGGDGESPDPRSSWAHPRARGSTDPARAPWGDLPPGGEEGRPHRGPWHLRGSHGGDLLPDRTHLLDSPSPGDPGVADGGGGEGRARPAGSGVSVSAEHPSLPGGSRVNPQREGSPGDPGRPGTSSHATLRPGGSGALLPGELQAPAVWSALRHELQRRGTRRHPRPFQDGSLDGSREPEAPTVHVTIGRVEVRAATSPPGSGGRTGDREGRESRSPVLGLEEYLRLRVGGGRP